MKIASFIVEAFEGKGEELKEFLSLIEGVTVYGEKDCKLVVVYEGEDLTKVNTVISEISIHNAVKNVLPVYISEI